MRLLGNIIWFILGGWMLFIVYSIAALIFYPIFIPIFRIAKYSLWPFGKAVVTQSQLNKYREIKGIDSDEGIGTKTLTTVSGIMNIIWMLSFGWILAALHLVAALVNLFCIFLIVTIPNIGGHWKMIPLAFMPFNKVIVPQSIADEIENEIIRKKINI